MRRYCLRLALLSLTAIGPVAVYGNDQQIAQQIVEKLRNRHQAQGIGELELIQGELNALQADLRRDLAYAELRNSYGQVFASAGLDPLPQTLPSGELADIAQALGNNEARWQRGDIAPGS